MCLYFNVSRCLYLYVSEVSISQKEAEESFGRSVASIELVHTARTSDKFLEFILFFLVIFSLFKGSLQDNFCFLKDHPLRLAEERTMAGSMYGYVRNFELPDPVLPNTYMMVRIDGKGFHK